ncbi:MAG: segregation/condensation protein A [Cyanobacteria bacterium P01_F01_bin.143]
MATNTAQIAIANLIDSAEKGEIDPWDVPVIEVIDRFLTELGLIGSTEPSLAQTNLPESGQTFLWASMLVLLKADTLQMLQEFYQEGEHDEDFADELLLEDEDYSPGLPPFLERHIHRRTSVPPRSKRRVTLQELIEQLEHIAAEIEAASTNQKPKKTRTSRRAAMRAIAQLAHNENLTELAMQLEEFLFCNFLKLEPKENFIDWEKLLSSWEKNQSHDEHNQTGKASIFWALLLLSSQSKVELNQEEFYQDLSIRPLNTLLNTN